MVNQWKDYVESIAINYQKSVNERINQLLEFDCSNYTCLGIDSTLSERNQTKLCSRYIYNKIQDLDSNEGKLLLKTLDL